MITTITIYKYYNELNFETYYVGSTTIGFEKRHSNHLTSLRKGEHCKELQDLYNSGLMVHSVIDEIEVDLSIMDIKQLQLDMEKYYYDLLQPKHEEEPKLSSLIVDEDKRQLRKKKMSKSQKWEGNGNHKLSKEEAAHVKWYALNGDITQREIGEMYSVGTAQVSRIKRGVRWKWLRAKEPSNIIKNRKFEIY